MTINAELMMDSIMDDIQRMVDGAYTIDLIRSRLDSRISTFESETIQNARETLMSAIKSTHIDGEA